MNSLFMLRLASSLVLVFTIVSCTPAEETGLARYLIHNQSDFEIRIAASFSVTSVTVLCDSCIGLPQSNLPLGEDAAFGYAPKPSETIESIRLYRNDTLKAEWTAPFADSTWIATKGQQRYDWDFILEVSNEMVQ